MRKILTLATGCALLAVTVACSGESVNSDTRTDGPTTTIRPKTPAEQLAIMVLPLEEYGDKFERLTIDDESGYVDAARQAEDTILPADTAADVEARGFISSYKLDFWNESIIRLRQTGVFAIGTEVAMFSDAFAASNFMAKEISDTQAMVGQDIGDGVVLTEVLPFELTQLGDQMFGAHVSFVAPGLTFYASVVWFRSGSHLASVDIAATYKGGEKEQASLIEWAHELEERIEGARAGTLDDEPVPVPTPAPTDTPAPTPQVTPAPPAP